MSQLANTTTNVAFLSKLGSKAGTAGGFLGAASNALGPIAMVAQVGTMLWGAHQKAKQVNRQKKALAKKADAIRENMISNASNLRGNLKEIDIETQEKQTVLGEDIGEKLEDSSNIIGETIRRGKGLLTGHPDMQKQEIIDDMSSYAKNQTEILNTQRGQQYSGLIDAHDRQMSQNNQSLLDIASQRKALSRQDSMWENLLA